MLPATTIVNVSETSIPKPTKGRFRKPKAPKKKTPPKRRNRRNTNMLNNSKRDCYAKLLNDPFNNPPCRIGFNCMVPTALGSCSFRSTTFCNTDGSLSIFASPFIGIGGVSPIYLNNSGLPTTTWSARNWDNVLQYPSTLMTECRTIALSLKVTPLVAMTNAPGMCFAGAVAGLSSTQLQAYSANTAFSIASLSSFITNNATMKVCGRPVDNACYEFLVNNGSGNLSNVYPTSSPFVTFTGFPSGTLFVIEAVYHFEYIPVANSAAAREINIGSPLDEEKISDFFSSAQEAWDYTLGRLNPSASIELASAGLNLYTSTRLLGGLNPRGRRQRLLQ